jgi:hypothetical protein
MKKRLTTTSLSAIKLTALAMCLDAPNESLMNFVILPLPLLPTRIANTMPQVGVGGGERSRATRSPGCCRAEDVERAGRRVAAAVRVVVPCSAAQATPVVALSFVSAVVGVLLVVPVVVSACECLDPNDAGQHVLIICW